MEDNGFEQKVYWYVIDLIELMKSGKLFFSVIQKLSLGVFFKI